MTYDELNGCIKSFVTHDAQCVIRLKYKYSHEESFSYSNEVFFYDYGRDDICWFNDWWEGQEECDFEYILNIDRMVEDHMRSLNCINNIQQIITDYRRGTK